MLLQLEQSISDDLQNIIEAKLRRTIRVRKKEPWMIEREPFHEDREAVKQKGIDAATNRNHNSLEVISSTYLDIINEFLDTTPNSTGENASLDSWTISSILDDHMDIYRTTLDMDDETANIIVLSTLQQIAFSASNHDNVSIFDSAFTKLRQCYQITPSGTDIADYTVLVIREVIISIPDLATAETNNELEQIIGFYDTVYSNLEWLFITAIREHEELSFQRFCNKAFLHQTVDCIFPCQSILHS